MAEMPLMRLAPGPDDTPIPYAKALAVFRSDYGRARDAYFDLTGDVGSLPMRLLVASGHSVTASNIRGMRNEAQRALVHAGQLIEALDRCLDVITRATPEDGE